MPVVVPILRLSLLFLNVYETFKTVRLPPPSRRNGGRPSIRAMTQRKRDMKGCLAVWIVWCCFALYERTLDGIVCIFVPFYNEIKSVVLLFMLLTRARGAEPIYLHVLRPIIKPHVILLDSLLEVIASLGDFLLLLVSVVVEPITSWYHRSPASHLDESSRSESSDSIQGYDMGDAVTPSSGSSISMVGNGQAQSQTPGHPNVNWNATHPPVNGFIAGRSVAPSSNSDGDHRQYASRSHSATASGYEIWHPPASSFEDPPDPGSHLGAVGVSSEGQVQVSSSTSEPSQIATDVQQPRFVDEWRQYPAFPSAYPPTPLPANAHLPSSRPQSVVAIQEDPEWRQYLPFPSAYPATPASVPSKLPRHAPSHADIVEEASDDTSESSAEGVQQGFDLSLRQPQKDLKPSSEGGLGDEIDFFGVSNAKTKDGDSMVVDDEDSSSSYEDDGDEEDEDDFDVTLRTPRRPPPRRRSTARQSDFHKGSATSDGHFDEADAILPTPRPLRILSTLLPPGLISRSDTGATRRTSTSAGLSTDHHGSSLRTTSTNSHLSEFEQESTMDDEVYTSTSASEASRSRKRPHSATVTQKPEQLITRAGNAKSKARTLDRQQAPATLASRRGISRPERPTTTKESRNDLSRARPLRQIDVSDSGDASNSVSQGIKRRKVAGELGQVHSQTNMATRNARAFRTRFTAGQKPAVAPSKDKADGVAPTLPAPARPRRELRSTGKGKAAPGHTIASSQGGSLSIASTDGSDGSARLREKALEVRI